MVLNVGRIALLGAILRGEKVKGCEREAKQYKGGENALAAL